MTVQKKHPIDNDRLKREFLAYRSTEEWKEFAEKKSLWDQNKAAGIKSKRPVAPPLPEYIGVAIWKIANGFIMKHNWRMLSHIKEDMVGDAVLACLKYAHNYNPNSGTSAFGYLTEGVKMAFLQRINKTKHESVKIPKLIVELAAAGQMPSYEGEMPGRHSTTHSELLMKHYDDVASLDHDVKNTGATTKRRSKRKEQTPVHVDKDDFL